MVFTSSDDPLSTRDTEARGDTVFAVDVSDVGLEAPRGLVVPETDCAVVRRGEDVL